MDCSIQPKLRYLKRAPKQKENQKQSKLSLKVVDKLTSLQGWIQLIHRQIGDGKLQSCNSAKLTEATEFSWILCLKCRKTRTLECSMCYFWINLRVIKLNRRTNSWNKTYWKTLRSCRHGNDRGIVKHFGPKTERDLKNLKSVIIIQKYAKNCHYRREMLSGHQNTTK